MAQRRKKPRRQYTAEEKAVLLEWISRQKANQPIDFLDHSFKAQTDFIVDSAKLKCGFCTRRAGKSYGAALYLVKEAYENPGVSCLYLALTRDSAKGILWKDCLKSINKKWNLEIKFNETDLTATFKNGSIIKLAGADATPDEQEKFLGQKYKLVIIDESASFKQDFQKLVYSTLKPAVSDYRGTIALIGTPGNLTKGLFFDITTHKEPGWSLHKWTAFDNPHMREQWAEEIAELKANHPLIVETPLFKQMYLGQWVVDESKLVYKYDPSRNDFLTLPAGNYRYVLGCDLGYEDDTSFVIGAYSDTDPTLYILECFKKSKMDITDVANQLKSYQARFNFSALVIDGANKQAVEEIRKRHGIPLKAADKTGKADFIEIMNGELIQGKIKVHQTKASLLTDEWGGLIWDDRASKRSEHPNCANHAADACLYLWRYTYSYLAQPEGTPAPKYGTREYFEQEEQRMKARAAEQVRKNIQKQNTDGSLGSQEMPLAGLGTWDW